MGFRKHFMELVDAAILALPSRPVCYLIGTQDIGFNTSTLLKRYPASRDDVPYQPHEIPDTKTVFSVMGVKEMKTVDINERADIKIDLTKELPAEHCNQSDLVCDFGTLEHIFDAKTAIENINKLLKPGGVILHTSPISFYQHGFYNFNPSFFESLYEGSGYEQVFRTMHVTVYNPLVVTDMNMVTESLRGLFTITNKILRPISKFSFNISLSRKGNNKSLGFMHFFVSHFFIPKNILYCCAYKKTSESLKIPYDIWT